MMSRWMPVAFVLFAFAAGCHTEKTPPLPTLHSVKGVVVSAGKPVKGGSVKFDLVDNPLPYVINGPVDESGRFELSTYKDTKRVPGAPEGKYRVVYSPAVIGKDAFPVAIAGTFDVAAKDNELKLDISQKE
jgi:hypothetical protein